MNVKLFSALAISAALLLPVAAAAQDPDAKPKRERSAEVGDGSRIICRTQEILGSRIKSGRVCMTADEWAAAKRDARNRVEQEQQRRPSQGN